MEQAFFPSLQRHVSLQPSKTIESRLQVPYFEGHIHGLSDHMTRGNFYSTFQENKCVLWFEKYGKCIGIIFSFPIRKMGSFTISRVPSRAHGSGRPLFIATDPIESCLDLSLQLQMTREPQEDLNCSSWSRFHRACYF
jgi:hypothetical protein